jgi:pyruvate/2-oxoacid:ferredoxin oxidoreductase alpha subunit
MAIQLMTANHASGLAATMAGRANREGRGFGSGIYPITPQTECIEFLCKQEIEKGHVVRVESEHSAMGVCIGFSMAGLRAFTASSSNGLAYMTENVFAAGFYRLPIVMMAVNRTMGPPWNIWVDHGDTLMLRDAGWIQLYCEDNQEVFDTTLMCFRLSEDPRLLLPSMFGQDAFVLSHTIMNTAVPTQEQVDAFLPVLDLPHRLSDKPRTIGGLDFPHEIEQHREHHAEAMDRVFEVYAELQDDFEQIFGRRPAEPVVPYRLDDAELVLVSMGTTASTARAAVDAARERGIKVGSLRVHFFRPFPTVQLEQALAGKAKIAFLDRDLSPGMGGILWAEGRAAAPPGALVQNFMLGLGGGDVVPKHLEDIIDELAGLEQAGAPIIKEVA